jgi:hypothetical protein
VEELDAGAFPLRASALSRLAPAGDGPRAPARDHAPVMKRAPIGLLVMSILLVLSAVAVLLVLKARRDHGEQGLSTPIPPSKLEPAAP